MRIVNGAWSSCICGVNINRLFNNYDDDDDDDDDDDVFVMQQ
jgi:hypothetical protein